MQLEAMLEKCRREQWSVDDLDWSGTPRPMSPADETAVVQYFTDMAGIERLAGALFAEQAKRATDPTLRAIFETFVRDEARHARVAERLAAYYDVHRFREYRMNEALQRFRPHFVRAIRGASEDVGNMYITGGELILDVALLRSLDDHVGDDMSHRAMDLVNRDESRHIAVDFHMAEYYASDDWGRRKGALAPKSLRAHASQAWTLANVVYHAAPFFRAVFFEPMRIVDPSGRRLREAFKRIQLLGTKPVARRSNFVRMMQLLQNVYCDHAVARLFFGRLIERVVGVDASVLARLYTEDERRRTATMSYDDLASEALAAKYAS